MAGCWTRKRLIVLFAMLEVLTVIYATRRLIRSHDNTESFGHRDEFLRTSSATASIGQEQLNQKPRARAAAIGLNHSPPGSLLQSFDIQRVAELVPPRAFPIWNNLSLPLPCPNAEKDWTTFRAQRSRTRTGILFVKVPKTGSSTGASVNLRIASRIYLKSVSASMEGHHLRTSWQSQHTSREEQSIQPNQLDSPAPRLCKNRVQHANTQSLGYDLRHRSRSVLWSVVRDPTDRALSEFFHFQVSRRGHNASDASVFRDFVGTRRQRFRNFQVQYLSLRKLAREGMAPATDSGDTLYRANQSAPDQVLPAAASLDAIRFILRDYDFLGVSERMDESLVVLQMLLGLETPDILHMSSKVSGGYDDGLFQNRCVRIQPSFRTPAMHRFFSGPMWRRWTKWDAVLHRAANLSLDLTIQELGPAVFRRQLEAFRELQSRVQASCAEQVRFPCDASRHDRPPRPSHETDCLLGDMGCGFDCIDRQLAAMAKS